MAFIRDKNGRIVGSISTKQSVAGAQSISGMLGKGSFSQYRQSKLQETAEGDVGKMKEEFELCLFDLDDTLIRTADMDELRMSGKNIDTDAYRKSVLAAYGSKSNRIVYSEDFLNDLKAQFPKMKFGIFTRSPKSYAETIVNQAYPNFEWDIGIAYETVERTKPYGDGIAHAIAELGISDVQKVALIGDGDNDVRSAYHAGSAVILDCHTWQRKRVSDNWRALGHMPDAMIDGPKELAQVLADLPRYQLDLETRMVQKGKTPSSSRFDDVGKFIPTDVGGDNTRFPVHTCSRYFSADPSLDRRRSWHPINQSIYDNKDSVEFPQEWVDSVSEFIRKTFPYLKFGFGEKVVVTVVPPRPERKPRLAFFLAQLEKGFHEKAKFNKEKLVFCPDLLVYQDGVRSHHGDGLSAIDRFKNVRDHLAVAKPELVANNEKVLVIDDVCTTGASLIYAGKYLQEAGASEVTRLSIAMNVSKVV